MRNNPFFSPKWVGAYSIFFSLLLLYFVEPIVTERNRSFEISSENKAAPLVFPMNEKLAVISAGKIQEFQSIKTTSFQELLQRTQRPNGTLLVNFWATWCDPCIEEIPSLVTLAEQIRAQSSNTFPLLVTISVDEKAEAVKKFEQTLQNKLPFLVLHDPEGALTRRLGIIKFPETFLIDSKGTVIQKWFGPQEWLSLEVLELLKKSCG